MTKPQPRRRPSIRVSDNFMNVSDADGWGLADWEKAYTKFAGEQGVPVEDVKIDIADFSEESATLHFYAYRDQTPEEERAEKQAAIDKANAERERMRKHIESLAERYPDLMPYNVQELP